MARGRPWTPEEDAAIVQAARTTRADGTHVRDDAGRPARAARLRDLALELGRTPAAVRKRAQRIGAYSYTGQPTLFKLNIVPVDNKPRNLCAEGFSVWEVDEL